MPLAPGTPAAWNRDPAGRFEARYSGRVSLDRARFNPRSSVNRSALGRVVAAPAVFLDVDGVLNAYAYDPLLAGYSDFELHEVTVGQESGFRMVFDLCLSMTMGKALAALPAEIVWLTTWEADADRIVAPLCGLPSGLRVLHPLTKSSATIRVGSLQRCATQWNLTLDPSSGRMMMLIRSVLDRRQLESGPTSFPCPACWSLPIPDRDWCRERLRPLRSFWHFTVETPGHHKC